MKACIAVDKIEQLWFYTDKAYGCNHQSCDHSHHLQSKQEEITQEMDADERFNIDNEVAQVNAWG